MNGLPNVPAVSGLLSYKLLHPCLANKGIVSFDKVLVKYDICQSNSETIPFTFTDTVSGLSSTANYCGSPTVSVVQQQDYS